MVIIKTITSAGKQDKVYAAHKLCPCCGRYVFNHMKKSCLLLILCLSVGGCASNYVVNGYSNDISVEQYQNITKALSPVLLELGFSEASDYENGWVNLNNDGSLKYFIANELTDNKLRVRLVTHNGTKEGANVITNKIAEVVNSQFPDIDYSYKIKTELNPFG